MAGEMIYILEQRIKNQKNISEEKGDLVLHDIISQTLKQKYLHEIFKPQHMFSRRHMRAMFERLAHSSIMRLSESSMEKLFDLDTHDDKVPDPILTVTMNHLSGMKRIAKQEDDIHDLIRNAHAMFLMLYGPVPISEWSLIRYQMLNFFQDCRVKVSVLLRDGKQFDDGHFVYLPQKDPIELPPDVEPPGTTKYYENGEFVKSTQWPGDTKLRTTAEYCGCKSAAAGFITTDNIDNGASYNRIIALVSMTTSKRQRLHEEGEVDLNMFDSTTEESTYVKETEAVLKNVLKIDASKDKKSISNCGCKADLIKTIPSLTISTKNPEFQMKLTSSDDKKKKGKGADMLEMLDEAAARPATGKSRSRSRTRTDPASKPRTPSGKRPASAKKISK
ncbi:hypothetical protein OSTOST_08225 [Ostertagia ostertagi]